MPEKVTPAESEGQEDNTESIDLFEVLEDRYAYEGFNKFAFYCFFLFALYQWQLSCFRYPDVAIAQHKLRRYRCPSRRHGIRSEIAK